MKIGIDIVKNRRYSCCKSEVCTWGDADLRIVLGNTKGRERNEKKQENGSDTELCLTVRPDEYCKTQSASWYTIFLDYIVYQE